MSPKHYKIKTNVFPLLGSKTIWEVPVESEFALIEHIESVDEKIMIIDMTIKPKESLKGYIYLVLIMWMIYEFFTKLIFPEWTRLQWWEILFFIVFGSLICLMVYYSLNIICRPVRKAYFNRQKGTVDVPAPWLKGWRGKTMSFVYKDVGIVSEGLRSKSMVIMYPNNKWFSYSLGIHPWDNKSLSLHHWYMDKNRPLPPGKIFDLYRDADFERRKSEGFPFPIYESRVETLEKTENQQKERDAVWPKEIK